MTEQPEHQDSRPAVVVVVGTDKHPFDRLVGWVDRWHSTRAEGPVSCLVQHATSRPPERVRGVPYLGHAALEELMRHSRVVVTHGGPTTISEARRFGHQPVVVPRRADLGEHVDDHQIRFTSRLADAGLVDIVDGPEQLADAIEARLGSAERRRDRSDDESTRAALVFAEVVEDVLRRRRRPRT